MPQKKRSLTERKSNEQVPPQSTPDGQKPKRQCTDVKTQLDQDSFTGRYEYVCTDQPPWAESDSEDDDDDDEEGEEEEDDEEEDGQEEIDVHGEPLSDHPNCKWMMLKECFDLLDDLATDADRRCPDQFGMYVHNDFYGYGMMEVLENMLRAFDNEIKPLSGKKANLQQMWAILTVLAMFLCRDVSFPWSMVDDGERYEHLIAVSGCAALTALNELDRVGQLKKDSRFLDLGHVMAMFLLWSKTATGMTVEGRIRHDPYDDDDAELEMYEWVGTLLAYAAKADIDLAEQRVSGIDKVLKRTTVGGLRGSAKADKWDWTATFRDYQIDASAARPCCPYLDRMSSSIATIC
ncbi:unnamed protein product [Zymoseptoria tritici ST99CH_3D1]|nr:unnamed protein product [Zymoseptoria tritici ST99CH_3D1]